MVQGLILVFAGIAIGVMLMSALQWHAPALRSWITRWGQSSSPGKRPPVAVMRYDIHLPERKRGHQ
jgi:hypothetical protein